MRELARRLIGADHEAMGAGLCDAWGLPKPFARVARNHHEPRKLPAAGRALPEIVCVADRVAARAGYGFRADLPELVIDPDVLADLRLTERQMESVGDRLPEACTDVEAALDRWAETPA